MCCDCEAMDFDGEALSFKTSDAIAFMRLIWSVV